MLKQTSMGWLCGSSDGPPFDQDYARSRAKLYNHTYPLLPSGAVSVYETTLYKLHSNGDFGDLSDRPPLSPGIAEVKIAPSLRLVSDLVIEDGSSYIEIKIDHLNPIGETLLRERIEAIEPERFVSFRPQDIKFYPDAGDLCLPIPPATNQEELGARLDGQNFRVDIPGDHSAPRFLALARDRDLSPKKSWEEGYIKSIYSGGSATPNPPFKSPAISLPTEKSWHIAQATVAGYEFQGEFSSLDKWLETFDLGGYNNFNAESQNLGLNAEDRLIEVFENPETPTIFIADQSPFFNHSNWLAEAHEALIDPICCDFGSPILRVTWPMQILLNSAGGTHLKPGSVCVCFPKAYRTKYGVANIVVTGNDVANEEYNYHR